MKKLIASAGMILIGGFFFAGFWVGEVFAQETEEELHRGITLNQCESIRRKIVLFEELKRKKDFDYTKFGDESEAYKFELDGYVHLENALSCMTEEDKTQKDGCVKTFPSKKIKKENLECSEKEPLDQLKFAKSEFSKAANFFDKAKKAYFGSRRLKLDDAVVYGENGKRIDGEGLDEIMTDNIVISAGDGFTSSTQDSLRNIFRGELIKKVNRALGTIAILYLFILGVKFIMARGDSERLSELKGQFAWIILGLGVISVAEFMGYKVFDSSKDILEGTAARNFEAKLIDVVRFVEYIAGGLMLINALISGYTLIMGGEEDETISREKQFLKSFLMGTAFILMAEVIVRALSFRSGDIHESSQIIVQEVAGLVNFALSFIGIVATAMLVLSGLYYVISFGDDDQMGRAKKMIMASIVGIIIAFSAYTIVTFLIT